ncbi:MAG: hypothetical protein ACRD3F_10460 [Acidobacteriaceae bacterium]
MPAAIAHATIFAFSNTFPWPEMPLKSELPAAPQLASRNAGSAPHQKTTLLRQQTISNKNSASLLM